MCHRVSGTQFVGSWPRETPSRLCNVWAIEVSRRESFHAGELPAQVASAGWSMTFAPQPCCFLPREDVPANLPVKKDELAVDRDRCSELCGADWPEDDCGPLPEMRGGGNGVSQREQDIVLTFRFPFLSHWRAQLLPMPEGRGFRREEIDDTDRISRYLLPDGAGPVDDRSHLDLGRLAQIHNRPAKGRHQAPGEESRGQAPGEESRGQAPGEESRRPSPSPHKLPPTIRPSSRLS